MNVQSDGEEGMVRANSVAAASEGSFMMAEAMLTSMAERGQGDTNSVPFEPYLADFDVEARHALAEAFFKDYDAANMRGVGTSARAEDGDEDNLKDDDDGMGDAYQTMGSREVTDPADWVLEAILKRKMNKDPSNDSEWVYLCRWKGYDEPLWEFRDVLEDYGFIPQLDAFDGRGAAFHVKKSSTTESDDACESNSQPQQKKWWHEVNTNKNASSSTPSSAAATAVAETPVEPPREAVGLERFYGTTDQEVFDVIKVKFAECGYYITRYCRMNYARQERFIEQWRRMNDSYVPTMVFHGTKAENLPLIDSVGFKVGGKGVAMTNGAAYGTGVYTAKSPSTPIGFARGCNAVIVAVGLIPRWPDVKPTCMSGCTDYLIFPRPIHVCPMWCVQFKRSNGVDCSAKEQWDSKVMFNRLMKEPGRF